MRFFAAVDNGVVIGSRRTSGWLTHAVIHYGPKGAYATFHRSVSGAEGFLQFYRETAPGKRVVRTVQTSTLLSVGRHLSVDAVLQP